MAPDIGRFICLAACLTVAGIGCDRVDARVKADCTSAQKWLGLGEAEMAKCVKDSVYRGELGAKRDLRLAEAMTRGHNQGLKVILPPAVSVERSVRIGTTSELPVSMLPFEEGAPHLGKRYVIRGRVSWGAPDDSGGRPFVWVHGIAGGKDQRGNLKDSEMAGVDALNEYQKGFLAEYCFSVIGEETSLCEGDVYLEIMRDSRGLFIRPQMLGAQFSEGNSHSVFDWFHSVTKLRGPESKR